MIKNLHILKLAFTIFIILLLTQSCSQSIRIAEYQIGDSDSSIMLALQSTHLFLAEYDRFLIIKNSGKEILKRKLFPNSGGYTTTNLYRCNEQQYFIKGYFDSYLIDLTKQAIVEGSCQESDLKYLGVFHGGGSEQWKFYSSEVREEQTLVTQGG